MKHSPGSGFQLTFSHYLAVIGPEWKEHWTVREPQVRLGDPGEIILPESPIDSSTIK